MVEDMRVCVFCVLYVVYLFQVCVCICVIYSCGFGVCGRKKQSSDRKMSTGHFCLIECIISRWLLTLDKSAIKSLLLSLPAPLIIKTSTGCQNFP